jgi:hypothetical protein
MSCIVGEPTLISVAQSRAFQLIARKGWNRVEGGGWLPPQVLNEQVALS